MIEEYLITSYLGKYGIPIAIIGILLWDKYVDKKKMKKVIERNDRSIAEIKVAVGIPNG